MKIRRIRGPRDRAAAEAIDRATFPPGESYALAVEPWTVGWLLIDPDRTIPVGFLTMEETDDNLELERFGILRVAQGRGASFFLLRALDRYARVQGWTRVTTYTAPDNVESMRALIRAGWLPADYEIDEDDTEWLLWERVY